MKKQIVQVSVLQSAKVIAGIYFVMTLPIVLFLACLLLLKGQGVMGLFTAAMVALTYPLGGFLGSLLGGWIYNLVAARIGGFEFTTAEVAPVSR